MNLNQASYRSPSPEPIEAAAPYPFETVLGNVRNVSHRRRTWAGWLLLALIVFAAIITAL
jgi:hypothetical protein